MKNRINKKILILTFIIVQVFSIIVAQSFNTFFYGKESGLPSQYVYSTTQDAFGKIWIVTDNGIANYNGKNWSKFVINYDKISSKVRAITTDEEKNIWFFTVSDSIKVYNIKGDSLIQVCSVSIKEFKNSDQFEYIAVSNANSNLMIVIVTASEGLLYFQNNKWKRITKKDGLISDKVVSLTCFNNKFYVCTPRGVSVLTNGKVNNLFNSKYNPQNKSVHAIAFDSESDFSFLLNDKILVFRNLNLYKSLKFSLPFLPGFNYRFNSEFINKNFLVFNNGGDVILLDIQNEEFFNLNKNSNIIEQSAFNVFVDEEKNVWVSTYLGLVKFSSLRFANYNQKDGLLGDEIDALIQKDDKIYVGHTNGFSILEKDGIKKVVFKCEGSNNKSKIINQKIIDFCLCDNKIWFAAQNKGFGLITKNNKTKFFKCEPKYYAMAVQADSSGTIWGLARFALLKFDGNKFVKSKLDFSKYPKIKFKKLFLVDNELWITTTNYGVFVVSDNKIKKHIANKQNDPNINNVFAVQKFNNRILVGTLAGLFEVKNSEIVSTQFELNAPVFSILIDKENNIWCGTNNGVYVIKGTEIRNYGFKSGLAGQETYRDALIMDSDNNIWIGTNEGLSKYIVGLDENSIKPKASILSLKVDKKTVNPFKPHVLENDANDLLFEIEINSFLNENGTNFRYMLKGYDKQWSDYVNYISNSKVQYTNLEPGKYRLKIQPRNSIGVVGEIVVSAEIKITEAFYNTFWFKAILFIIVIGIIIITIFYTLNLRYTKKLKEKVWERTLELNESERKYREMFEENKAVMLIIDPATKRIIAVNKSALKFYNYPYSQIVGKHINEIDYYDNSDYLNSKNKNNQSYYISRHKLADGSYREVEVYLSVITEKGKDLLYVIVHDINEKKAAEDARIESEERYSTLINSMHDGVFVYRDGKILFANAALLKMIGFDKDEVIGASPYEFVCEADIEFVRSWYRDYKNKNQTKNEYDIRLINKYSKNLVYVSVKIAEINFQGKIALLGTANNITIKKRQEEQLRKLSITVEQNPNAVIITDLNGDIEYVNSRFTKISGYGFGEVFKQNPRILKNEKMNSEVYKDLWKSISSGKTWRGELLNKSKSGNPFWVLCTINSIKNEKGEITHFAAIEIDITEKKKIEEQNKKNQRLLNSVLNSAPMFIFALDKHLNISLIKGKALVLIGLSEDKILNNSFDSVFRKYEIYSNELKKLKPGEKLHHIKKINDHYFELEYLPIYENNKFIGINGIGFDITERYSTQAALIESEEKFRSLFENTSVGVYRSTIDGKILMANPWLVSMLGYSSFEELKEIKIPDPEFNFKIDHFSFVEELKKHGSVSGIESTWYGKNNQVIYVRESARAIKNDDDEILYYDGIIEDITDKKNAELELIKSLAKNRAMLNAIPDIFIEINLEGKILSSRIPKKERRNLNISEEIDGKNIKEIFDKSVAEKLIDSAIFTAKTQSIQIIEFSVNKGNAEMFYEARIILADSNSVVAIIRDITNQKETEKILIKAKEEAEKSDKLKSEFLAQMSHEIRTPINSILSFTSLIKEELQDKISEDLIYGFEAIDNGSNRLIRTIDSILNMSQIQTGTYNPSFSTIDLNTDILESVYKQMLPSANGKSIELNYLIETEQTHLQGDSYTLGQIFINLVDNAIKYTNKGKVDIKLYRNNSNKLCVDIIDTGIGISKEYLPNLFLPFSQEESGYTRKYEGNGLGLALVQNYAEMNSATITVNSEKGKGSTFTVRFLNS